ncbi:MAG: hypothetical protein PWR29_611, partial [Methanolobus sp.]|nr:hypothetical protein [Methanolobus sp.]
IIIALVGIKVSTSVRMEESQALKGSNNADT